MKKTLLLLAAVASFGAASAQKVGDIFVYGSIGYLDVKTEQNGVTGSHDRRFTTTPGVGYQFNPNWGAGLMGEFTTAKTGTNASLASNELFVGPFVRYTRNLSNLFFVFGQLDAGYIRTNRPNGTATTNDLEGNGFGVRVTPNVGVNVSRSLALIGSFGNLGYSRVQENVSGVSNSDVTTAGINASFGSNFTLGVQWNFGTVSRRPRMEPMDDTRRMDTRDDNEDMPRAPRRRRSED